MKRPTLLLLAAMLAACAPKLNWREVRPEGAGLLALFPCKPEVANRRQPGAAPGQPALEMGLAACKAGESSFSLAWAELDDPSRVAPALQEMRESLVRRLDARPGVPEPFAVPGMTPGPQALQQTLVAARQQGRVAVFSRGLKVYQLVVLGPAPEPTAWETFSAALRLEQ